jgi:hypothetical protein
MTVHPRLSSPTRRRDSRPLSTAVLGLLALIPVALAPQTQAPAAASTCTTAPYEDGVGTSESPYQIKTEAQLLHLADTEIDWDGQKHFRLTANLDLTGCTWTPIGRAGATKQFDGVFDGGTEGYTITGLTYVNTASGQEAARYIGMFGFTAQAAELRNIRLVDVHFEGRDSVGGLVGNNEGTIENSSVTGESSVSATDSNSRVGGLVGTNNSGGVILNSASAATVSGVESVGGLVGEGSLNSRIVNSFATGDVSGTEDVGGLLGFGDRVEVLDSHATGDVTGGKHVGGLIGFATGDGTTPSEMTIRDSFATGDVTGVERVGGLIGKVDDGGIIESSYATGSVTGTGDYVGGLVGESDASIVDSYATGTVEGGSRTGGLVGSSSGSGSIERSFAIADVTGANRIGGLVGSNEGSISDSFANGSVTSMSNDDRVGGLVGNNSSGSIVKSYSTGAVTGPGPSDVGGLVGRSAGSVSDSYWDLTIGPAASAGGGEGRTTSQMRQRATFADWAFVGDADPVWGICEGESYPFLLWFTDVETECGSSGEGGDPVSGPSATPVLTNGATPAVPAGSGVWQLVDGTQVPLSVSSSGVNQLRYASEGIRVTLTGGAGTSVSNGLVANPNGEIVCEVCSDLPVGQVIEVWMFSTPRLVAAHLIGPGECRTFTIPLGAPLDGGAPVSAGAHTLQLALPTASGMQAVNVGVTVGGPVPASVPAGEGAVPTPGPLLALTLLIAAGAVVAARRQVVAG